MVKKILAIIAGCTAILLALFFFLTVLFDFRDFFGPAITGLLLGCIVILMLFVIYLMTSWIIEAVRQRHHDEDSLSEHHLEKLLAGEDVGPGLPKLTQAEKEENLAEKREARKTAALKKADLKKALKEEKERAALEAKLLKEEQKRQAAEEKRNKKLKAKPVAKAAPPPQEEPKIAVAPPPVTLAPAVKIASEQVETKQQAQREAAQAELQNKEEQAAAERKAQAIASARKQAEAVAATRRRAAQTAARTQAFAPIDPDNLPTFNTQIIDQIADVAENKSPLIASEPENIWEKMQVRQSAAPVLPQREKKPAAQYGVVNENLIPGSTGSFKAIPGSTEKIWTAGKEAGQETNKTSSWTYSPTKQKSEPKKAPPARKAAELEKPQMQDVPSSTQSLKKPAAPAPQKPAATAPGTKTMYHKQGETAKSPVGQTTTTIPPFPGQTGQFPRQTGRLPNLTPIINGHTGTIPKRPPVPDDKLREKTKAMTAAAAALADPPVEEPKRPRGRPPKPKDPEELNKPKRPRGRPPKPKDPEELNKPKRPRGRPPKPKDPEELDKPKRPRGRPPKDE